MIVFHSLGDAGLQGEDGASNGDVIRIRVISARWQGPKAAQEAALVAYLSRYLGPQIPRGSVHATATAPPIAYSGPPQP
jgi:hypothetical protein